MVNKNRSTRMEKRCCGKVVFLIRNVGQEKFGGGEIYQIRLARKLSEVGLSPVIVSNSTELLKRAKEEGFVVLVPPYSKNQNWSGYRNLFLPFYRAFQIKLKRWYEKAIENYKPIVINIQSRDDMIAGTLAAKRHGVKVLWTDHADFKNWVLWNVNKKLKNVIGKEIIKLSGDVDRVIFISEKIEEETKKLIFPQVLQNTIVIRNGVEDCLKEYKDVIAKPMSFVFIGRVVQEKGIVELINGFKEVVKKHPKAVLNIYGQGEVAFYKKLSSDCVNIKFHGMTNEPLRALAENQFFVLPSYMEGLSLSLLDAAMMEKTIIATDVGGNGEVVKNNESGLLIPPRDVKKLVSKMNYVLENKKEAVRFANNVRGVYEEYYNFDVIFAKKMLPMYNLNKKKGEKR